MKKLIIAIIIFFASVALAGPPAIPPSPGGSGDMLASDYVSGGVIKDDVLPADIIRKAAGDLTAGQLTCADGSGDLESCGAKTTDNSTNGSVLKKVVTVGVHTIENATAGTDYLAPASTVAATDQGNANINIDGVSASDYNYSNGASAAAYTYVITSAPAAGKVRYITLTIGGGAGVVTSTWTNISWIGTAGSATTTTNKKSTYSCIIRNSGSQCAIVAEAY